MGIGAAGAVDLQRCIVLYSRDIIVFHGGRYAYQAMQNDVRGKHCPGGK